MSVVFVNGSVDPKYVEECASSIGGKWFWSEPDTLMVKIYHQSIPVSEFQEIYEKLRDMKFNGTPSTHESYYGLQYMNEILFYTTHGTAVIQLEIE